MSSKVIDNGAIELLGPFGLTSSLYYRSTQVSSLDTGVLTQYALYIMIGLTSLLLVIFLPLLIF